jgi:hypothetical protein
MQRDFLSVSLRRRIFAVSHGVEILPRIPDIDAPIHIHPSTHFKLLPWLIRHHVPGIKPIRDI